MINADTHVNRTELVFDYINHVNRKLFIFMQVIHPRNRMLTV